MKNYIEKIYPEDKGFADNFNFIEGKFIRISTDLEILTKKYPEYEIKSWSSMDYLKMCAFILVDDNFRNTQSSEGGCTLIYPYIDTDSADIEDPIERIIQQKKEYEGVDTELDKIFKYFDQSEFGISPIMEMRKLHLEEAVNIFDDLIRMVYEQRASLSLFVKHKDTSQMVHGSILGAIANEVGYIIKSHSNESDLLLAMPQSKINSSIIRLKVKITKDIQAFTIHIDNMS
jgi:hypothetical protein